MTSLELTIADKNLSSWSMRPWLLMKVKAIPFEEVKILFASPGQKEAFARASPAALVPVLRHGHLVVWDSLAIIEYLADLYPDKGIWPADIGERAVARSVSAEMHSGFSAVRTTMPMNICGRMTGFVPARPAKPEIARILKIWTDLRAAHGEGGDFLFGGFTAADAMFAPVVTRLRTYGIALDGAAKAYSEAILSLDAMQDWEADAQEEVSETN